MDITLEMFMECVHTGNFCSISLILMCTHRKCLVLTHLIENVIRWCTQRKWFWRVHTGKLLFLGVRCTHRKCLYIAYKHRNFMILTEESLWLGGVCLSDNRKCLWCVHTGNVLMCTHRKCFDVYTQEGGLFWCVHTRWGNVLMCPNW